MADRTPRELLAEFELLRIYDATRLRLGHDYGNGQRGAELIRRRRELEARGLEPLRVLEDAPPTELELELAFARIGRARTRAAVRNCHSYGTAAARRTFDAWKRVERRYGRIA